MLNPQEPTNSNNEIYVLEAIFYVEPYDKGGKS